MEIFQDKSGGLIAENKGPNGSSNIGAIHDGGYTVYKNVFFEFQCALGSLEVCDGGLHKSLLRS